MGSVRRVPRSCTMVARRLITSSFLWQGSAGWADIFQMISVVQTLKRAAAEAVMVIITQRSDGPTVWKRNWMGGWGLTTERHMPIAIWHVIICRYHITLRLVGCLRSEYQVGRRRSKSGTNMCPNSTIRRIECGAVRCFSILLHVVVIIIIIIITLMSRQTWRQWARDCQPPVCSINANSSIYRRHLSCQNCRASAHGTFSLVQSIYAKKWPNPKQIATVMKHIPKVVKFYVV